MAVYPGPTPSERQKGPIAAMYHDDPAFGGYNIFNGTSAVLPMDIRDYDMPDLPYADQGTGQYVFNVPHYAGYLLELNGIVSGGGGTVDLYYMVDGNAYIWMFNVDRAFDLHKLLILGKGSRVAFFGAVPGFLDATIYDLRGGVMLVSL